MCEYPRPDSRMFITCDYFCLLRGDCLARRRKWGRNTGFQDTHSADMLTIAQRSSPERSLSTLRHKPTSSHSIHRRLHAVTPAPFRVTQYRSPPAQSNSMQRPARRVTVDSRAWHTCNGKTRDVSSKRGSLVMLCGLKRRIVVIGDFGRG